MKLRTGKKRVLILDTWSEGINHINKIKPLFSLFDVYYVHINSINEKYLPDELKNKLKSYENPYDITLIDLQEYDYSINELFNAVNPQVFLVISIHDVFIRWANIIAQNSKAIKVHIMHGVKGEDFFEDNLNGNLDGLSKRLDRVKYVLNVLFLKIRELKWRYFSKGYFKEDLKIFKNYNEYKFKPKKSGTVKYDHMVVTRESDIEFYKKYYGIKDAQYIINGPIDVCEIYDSKTEDIEVDTGTVLYISAPIFKESDKHIKLINSFKSYLEENDFNLKIRFHPRDNLDYKQKIIGKGFEISDESLDKDLMKHQIIAGINSTVLLTAQGIGKTIIQLKHEEIDKYLKLNNVDYYEFRDGNFDISKLKITNKSVEISKPALYSLLNKLSDREDFN